MKVMNLPFCQIAFHSTGNRMMYKKKRPKPKPEFSIVSAMSFGFSLMITKLLFSFIHSLVHSLREGKRREKMMPGESGKKRSK